MSDHQPEASVTVPLEILRALQPQAEALGLDLGLSKDGKNDPVVVPPIRIDADPVTVSQQLGDQLKDKPIFCTPAGDVVTLDAEGRRWPMEPAEFVTWAGERVHFYRKRTESGDPIRTGIKVETARIILASWTFKSRLRKLVRVMPVRVPVRRPDGKVELLPEGYDWDSGSYVVDRCHFETDWPLEKAVEHLRGFVKDFPWGDSGRSLSVWVTSLLAPFCHVLAPQLAPMFFFNANAAGSGKTTLARMGAIVVYGHGGVKPWSREDGKFREELNATAKANRPVLILDNVKGHVSSEDLEAWLTTADWEFRAFHRQDVVVCRKNTITYLSGNEATLSDDLIRRSLIVDLFSEESVDDRAAVRKSEEIDEFVLSRQDVRRGLLAALWALVRNWADAGCPEPASKMPSYQAWAKVVAGIVVAAGFSDPLAKAELAAGGDASRTEFRALLEAARAAHKDRQQILMKLPEWAALARKAGLYHTVLGSLEEKRQLMVEKRLFVQPHDEHGPKDWTEEDFIEQASRHLDKSESTKFAGILHRKRAIRHKLGDGRHYQFGSRQSRRSAFELVCLDPLDVPDSTPQSAQVAPF